MRNPPYTLELSRGLCLALAVAGLSFASSGRADTLEVELSDDIRAGEQVVVAVYDHESNWLKKYVGGVKEQAAQPGAIRVHIDGLAPGRYAIAAYVDRDGNGKLGRNLLGIPSEPVGFSGAPARFGAPAFDAAAFELPVGGTTVQIQLH